MNNKFLSKIISGCLLCSILTYGLPVFAYTNEETVYSKLNSEGDRYKTIVTTIEKDKVSQENSDKDLPIELKVTYFLDGKEISAEKIVGKSGKVTIKIEYENKDKKEVQINGKTETMYTPFLAMTGVILDNETCKNVEISSGELVNNGNKTIAVGFAIPGMSESLKLENKKISNEIEISLETDKFELGNIITYATPNMFGNLDLTLNDFEEMFNKVEELQSASIKLEDGANQLKDGIVVLNDGANTLDNGAGELNTGISSLKSGTQSLSSGANTLNSKYSELDNGIKYLDSKSKELNNGASSLYKGLSQISGGLVNAETGVNQIYALLSGINQKLDALIAGIPTTTSVNSNFNVNSVLESSIQTNQNEIAKLESSNIELENVKANVDETTKASLDDVISKNKETIENLKLENENLTAQKNNLLVTTYSNSTDITPQLTVLNSSIKTALNGVGQIKESVEKLNGVFGGVVDGAKKLSDGTSSLVSGTQTLSSGSTQVANGINDLENGANTLNSGAGKILDGSQTLKAGTSSLLAGTKQLETGSNTLVSGISSFNKDGISKICDVINKDVKDTVTRIEKLEDISKAYNVYSSDKKREEIKFINVMDSIKASDKKEKNKK